MSENISLIVGLGNPGSKYEPTRHNAGFWFLDLIAERHGVKFGMDTKLHGEVARIAIDGKQIWLLKPTTFMNRSGQAVSALAGYYKIPVESVLVAHDELDLPPGQLRIKQGGGHAGHNGLRDIIAHMGKEFIRLRVGIGRPDHPGPVTDYVLGNPGKLSRQMIDDALDDTELMLDKIVGGEMAKAMNRLHGRGKV
ncbi:MAG: aminoacyl-tRNA hydrolase [Gammaproteobacteria bacterium]|uniref:Peptidyl-tRNA hydrolase n=1 Tax=Candidatus Thiopontia autotrophica TaxID=2841688 RepID=A0A8J6P908_9GAMM|nr:aminoacyl-tRNA hydrolase [Candidatus Thiopontia autotrophica]MBL6968615.1 aminoacyl-tRNA hydrolase [Gammaproteobacteria bacterium]